MKLLNNFIVICLLILLNINIAFAANIMKELRFYQQIKLPYSSNQLKKYYYWNKIHEIQISANNKTPLRFNEQDFLVDVKSVSHDSGFATGGLYFPVFYFKFNDILYTGIIYMALAENDTNVITFRLNSYNPEGKLIDAILLDQRFEPEGEVLYWNDFTIKANGTILVNQKEKLLIDVGLSDFKKGEIKSKKSQYQMTKTGLFKKLK